MLCDSKQVNYMVEKFQSMPAIDEAITEKGYEYFLMILGDTPIGYMGVAPDDGALLLSKLYLMKPFRGQRRSNLFFDKAEEVAKEKGFRSSFRTSRTDSRGRA